LNATAVLAIRAKCFVVDLSVLSMTISENLFNFNRSINWSSATCPVTGVIIA
jgi:hypothetical protein